MADHTGNEFAAGTAHYRAGRLDEAARSWRRAASRAPANPKILWNLGVVLKELSAWTEACAVWRSVLALSPADIRAHRNLALVLHGQGRFDDAVLAYRRTIDLNNGAGRDGAVDMGEVWWNLGVALKALRRWSECADVWRRISRGRPDDAVCRTELGFALSAQGRLGDAEAACRRSVALNPAHAGAWFTLGGVRRTLGDADGAIAIYGRLLALKPDFPEARKRLDEASKCRDALATTATELRAVAEGASLEPVVAMLAPVAIRFDEAIEAGGTSPRGTLNHDPDLHRLSLERLTAVFGPEVANGGLSVNDLGCGYGALFNFLKDGPALTGGRYIGYDISREMIEAARATIRDPRAHFLQSYRATEVADYSIVAGTYNLCLTADADAWFNLVKESLRSLARMTRRGLAFNMLSRHVAEQTPGLFYADPAAMIDFCLREIGGNVVLLHDYAPIEFTVHVKAPFR
ncbi:MAG TPA: tetratricopeptide repeat protein [Azospirillum sp.]|nr:tetratricopeptide repeat protein [Azospirillum sp.]